jgi:hypothetical protein
MCSTNPDGTGQPPSEAYKRADQAARDVIKDQHQQDAVRRDIWDVYDGDRHQHGEALADKIMKHTEASLHQDLNTDDDPQADQAARRALERLAPAEAPGGRSNPD